MAKVYVESESGIISYVRGCFGSGFCKNPKWPQKQPFLWILHMYIALYGYCLVIILMHKYGLCSFSGARFFIEYESDTNFYIG